MRTLLTVVAAVGVLGFAGCDALKKKKPTAATTPTDETTVTRGPGGGVVVGAPAAGGGGGGGAVMGSIKAAKRLASQNDFATIRIYIENASGATGKMPTVAETYAALQKEAPKIAELVGDGTIVLHAARTREDVWAYERTAYDSRGWVLTSQGAEQMDAATLRQRLSQ